LYIVGGGIIVAVDDEVTAVSGQGAAHHAATVVLDVRHATFMPRVRTTPTVSLFLICPLASERTFA